MVWNIDIQVADGVPLAVECAFKIAIPSADTCAPSLVCHVDVCLHLHYFPVKCLAIVHTLAEFVQGERCADTQSPLGLVVVSLLHIREISPAVGRGPPQVGIGEGRIAISVCCAQRHVERGRRVAVGLCTADAALMTAEHVVVFPLRRRRSLAVDGPEVRQSHECSRADALERGGKFHV